MSEEYGYDPFEYAQALPKARISVTAISLIVAHGGRKPGPHPARPARQGRRSAAAIGGLGALAGSGRRAASRGGDSGKFTGTLRVLTLGVEFPIPDIAKQASKDLGFTVKPILAVGEAAADRDHLAGHVRRLRRLQLPVASGLAVRRPAAGGHAQLPNWNSQYKLFTYGKLNPASASCTFGQGNAPFRTTFVDPNGSTGLPAYSNGPASNKQIVRWIGEDGKPIGGKPQPRWIVGPAAHFNADSMGYNADVIKKAPNQVSWAELLNTKWKGRVVPPPRPGHHDPGRGRRGRALGF